ncbi:MAG: hypothetical protein EXS16_16400 [Gemmataceae bacterium]|nr:hypothetical protein [Gemmataceae bacterium]
MQSLDPELGTLSVSQPPKGQAQSFSLVKKDLPITDSSGARLKLTDLKKHDRMVLTTFNDEDVIAIRVESNFDWGVVTHVDVARNELIANLSYMPRPVKITPQMRVSLDGKTGSAVDLREVKPWSHGVRVLLTPDRTGVQEMWITKGKYHGNPYGHRISVTGFLVRHDPVKKTLSLITSDRYQIVEVAYDSWTQLRLVQNFNTLGNVPVSQLQSPAKVIIGYDSDTRRTTSINLEVPMVLRRHVAAIDLATRKISLEASGDSPAEDFRIAADAKITRLGKELCVLADVKVKYIVSLGLSLDQKEVLYLSFTEK